MMDALGTDVRAARDIARQMSATVTGVEDALVPVEGDHLRTDVRAASDIA